MVFQTKKLQLETLSEYLREIREAHSLTIAEVSIQTGIKQQFLEHLENAEYQKLPPDVYAVGFLNELARIYGVPPEILINQFKKERGMVDPKNRPGMAGEFNWQAMVKRIIITPKLVSVAAGALFLCITIGYVVFQLILINSPPKLSVNQPSAGAVVNDSTVMVSGQTEPGVELSINGQSVFVNSQGGFEARVGISPGQNELQFLARDKFDHEVTKKLSVISQAGPQVLGATDVSPQADPLSLNLRITRNITLTYIIDDSPQVIEEVLAGTIKDLSAKNKIVLSVSDGSAVTVKLNNKSLGTLGKTHAAVNKVEFTQQSASAME